MYSEKTITTSIIPQMKRATHVLDIGAGRWHHSLLAASFGCNVDAIDKGDMTRFKRPNYLTDHPRITFTKHDLNQGFATQQSYDLILSQNVVMFLNKKVCLPMMQQLFEKNLRPGGLFCLTFFGKNDDILLSNPATMRLYTPDDWSFFWSNVSFYEREYELYDWRHAHVFELIARKSASYTWYSQTNN